MEAPLPAPIQLLSRVLRPGELPSIPAELLATRQKDQSDNTKLITIVATDDSRFVTTEKIVRLIPHLAYELDFEPDSSEIVLRIPPGDRVDMLSGPQVWSVLQFFDYHCAIPYERNNTTNGVIEYPLTGFDAGLSHNISTPEQIIDLIHVSGYLELSEADFVDFLGRCFYAQIRHRLNPVECTKIVNGYGRTAMTWEIRQLCFHLPVAILEWMWRNGNEGARKILNLKFFRRRCNVINLIDDQIILPKIGDSEDMTVEKLDVYLPICTLQGELSSDSLRIIGLLGVAARAAFIHDGATYVASMKNATRIGVPELYLALASNVPAIMETALQVFNARYARYGSSVISDANIIVDLIPTPELVNSVAKIYQTNQNNIMSYLAGYLNLQSPINVTPEHYINQHRLRQRLQSLQFYLSGHILRINKQNTANKAEIDFVAKEMICLTEQLSGFDDDDDVRVTHSYGDPLIQIIISPRCGLKLNTDIPGQIKIAFASIIPISIRRLIDNTEELLMFSPDSGLNESVVITADLIRRCKDMLAIIAEFPARISVSHSYILILKILQGITIDLTELERLDDEEHSKVMGYMLLVAHPQIRYSLLRPSEKPVQELGVYILTGSVIYYDLVNLFRELGPRENMENFYQHKLILAARGQVLYIKDIPKVYSQVIGYLNGFTL